MKTHICGSTQKYRLLTDYLNSFTEHPAETMTQLETYSPIYISRNEGPMIFSDNVFEDNIGLRGGAISIDRPNMQV